MTMICTIPARSGSKRLPRKNVLNLADKPMIAYSIEAARDSGLFDHVYVCTDDQRIADIAIDYGADVPMLMPAELCDDLVPSHAPCTFLAESGATHEQDIDAILVLQPSSPLRSSDDIQQCVARFKEGDVDFVVSATPIDPHYFHWALVPPEQTDTPYWQMYFGDKFHIERPLLPPVFRPNGSIKIANLQALKTAGNFFGAKLGVIETPEERSIHVATQFDFDLCEYLLLKERR